MYSLTLKSQKRFSTRVLIIVFIVVAAIGQWRRCLSAYVSDHGGRFEHNL